MAPLLGGVRVPGCRLRRLASTQAHQVQTKGRQSLEAIDQATLARLRRHPHPPNPLRPMSMLHSLRAIVYGRHTIPKLQGCAKRVLEDLQACATLRHTHTSLAPRTMQAPTRTPGGDNNETLMAVARLEINSRRCIQTLAMSLKPTTSAQVLETSNEHHQKHHIHRPLLGTKMPLQPHHPSEVLLRLGMCPAVSRAEAKKAST